MRLPFVLARRFVAGETLEEALPVVGDLNACGMKASLDLLGEYVSDRDKARAATEAYLTLVRTIAEEREVRRLDSNISIKLSMLGQMIDEDFCRQNLQHLLRCAREKDIFVRLDMEGSDTTASTLALFEDVFAEFPDHVGVVLQAYLKRTEQDVERMCELNARVRICKGAYREPSRIAYQKMDKIRERFLAYTKMLIEHARYPGIATHDDRLIAGTKQFAAENGISHDRFEFQMLYGIRPDTQVDIVRQGYNMRVYIPYGTEWVPYFTRRLRERKENVWFVLRNLFRR